MTNEIQVTNAEQYQKAALNTLKRQITMGVNIPKNFDLKNEPHILATTRVSGSLYHIVFTCRLTHSKRFLQLAA